jgi:Fic family protein
VSKLTLDDKKVKVLNTLFNHEPDGFEGGMTAKKYINLTGVSKPTATRDLAELAKLDCLISLGGGRSTHYQLALEKYR